MDREKFFVFNLVEKKSFKDNMNVWCLNMFELEDYDLDDEVCLFLYLMLDFKINK